MTKIGLKRQQEMVRKWSIAKLSMELSVLYMFTIFCAYIKTGFFFPSFVFSYIAGLTSGCNWLSSLSLALYWGKEKWLKNG